MGTLNFFITARQHAVRTAKTFQVSEILKVLLKSKLIIFLIKTTTREPKIYTMFLQPYLSIK